MRPRSSHPQTCPTSHATPHPSHSRILIPTPPRRKASLHSRKPYIYKTSARIERKREIYFPPHHNPTDFKVPGLILFHGGGWKGGSLDQFRHSCSYFASRGLVCATAEYQMLNKTSITQLPADHSYKRACVTDAKSAIRWFKHNAAAFGIDPSRIITGGGGAGGHISALATMNPRLNAPNQKHSFFNTEPWRTTCLLAADEFLTKHNLLTGKPTLTPSPSHQLLPTGAGSGQR